MVLQDYMTNQIPYNSTARVAITTKLGRMVAHLDELLLKSHMIIWSRDLARSSNKPKSLYLCYHSAYDRKTS